MAKHEVIPVTKMIAVDLVGHGAQAAYTKGAQLVVEGHPAPTAHRLSVAECRTDDAEHRHEPERAEGREGEWRVEPETGRQVEWAVAEKGVRIGVLADGEVAVRDGGPVLELNGQPGRAAVVVAEPRGESGVDEQRMPGPPFEAAAPLDLLDDGRIEPDTDGKQEVPPVDRSQPDA